MRTHNALQHATWAVKHPLSATAQTVGLVKGAVAAVTGILTRGAPGQVSEQERPTSSPDQGGPHVVIDQRRPPAAEQRAPAPAPEAFVTEPTAVSRASAHAGHGADADIDDWYGDVDADPVPEGVIASLELGDGDVLVDQAAINAELSRSETARRGAERDPGPPGS